MNETISVVNTNVNQRKKPKFSEEQRKKHCQNYQDSGLGVKEYCEVNNISQSALRTWMGKYPSKTLFTPVSRRSLISHSNKQSCEVMFANGVRLRFPELVDVAIIKQLIKEVGLCN